MYLLKVKTMPKLEALEKQEKARSRKKASSLNFYIQFYLQTCTPPFFCLLYYSLGPIKNFSLENTPQKVLLILANFLAYLDQCRKYYLVLQAYCPMIQNTNRTNTSIETTLTKLEPITNLLLFSDSTNADRSTFIILNKNIALRYTKLVTN